MTHTPTSTRQPYAYTRRTLTEPDWTRYPGWRHITRDQWESAQWQRAHCIKNIRQLHHVLGPLADDTFYDDLATDQARTATMPMLLPPQMLNTMVPHGPTTTDALRADPIRRYMLPLHTDRIPDHPLSTRDSLHEHDMWAAEGLTHRYPTKVLAELTATCPQYCGHCTRMDLVGTNTPAVTKLKLTLTPADRHDAHLHYLRHHPEVRDIVVSGGDLANIPWPRLETYLMRLLDLDTIRDIRLATKALAALPQHWLQPHIVEGLERVARTAARRGVNLALHTHVNHAQTLTPLVARATHTALAAGIRDVRNQGVLLRGINDTADDLLDLCFALQGEAGILPYYLYLCDMIPGAEHWRLPLHHAQTLQHDILGYLPGYATPRIVCDVPYVGKRWVHMAAAYDRVLGISHWTKNYRTPLTDDTVTTGYPYYDPIDTLPEKGRAHWATRC
ncbi:KamA family radical SAM protein [Catenuloplanes atrovinosus]|uniref:Lysine 2,3-aminomutase n=1 Tax=Catenuloplanes atrovinosus TaxID=137266 RepID=A0AAE3YM43_9ACTN|nr:lysine 2,3-aminomutase [Catenuloplanes atrovinosus]MDR7276050.1 lysine 2,3-aminomutase [Catenuloplanes atrovinosus]